MGDFWQLARLMFQRRGKLLGAIVFAAISAVGLGAGLLMMAPVLKIILGEKQGLPDLARRWTGQLPAWLRPGEQFIASLPTAPFDAVVWVVVGLAALTVIGATANFLHQYLALTVVSSTVGDIRVRAFRRLVNLPLLSVLGARDSARGPQNMAISSGSDAISRIVGDASSLGSGFNALLSKAVAQITKGGAALLAAFVLDWKVAILAIPVAIVLAWIIRKLGKRVRRATRAALQGQASLYQAASEVVGGLRVVKVHTTEEAETQRFQRLSDQVVRQEFRVRTARALGSPMVETLAIFVLGALVLIATKAIIDGNLDPGGFILVLASLGVAGASLKPLTSLVNDVQQAGAAAQRLNYLLRLPIEDAPNTKPPLARHARSIAFENVSFTYPAAAEQALAGVTLEVPHGSTVAFVGPNGSGKTTLLALIPRLFDPLGGRVLIDGNDVRKVDLPSLRDQIAVVTQDTILFKGSIRANIAYGRAGASDEAIADAARRAHADGFVAALPSGYDALLGEGGVGLSGGQRQRLAIARAILRDPAILILDEATSMIDAESEFHIAAAIDEFVAHPEKDAARRTCLIVAHRLSTVMHADLIVVMDRGRVVDTGKHADLLHRCDLYRSLALRQLADSPVPRADSGDGLVPAPTAAPPTPSPANV